MSDRDVEEYSADTVLLVPGARELLRDARRRCCPPTSSRPRTRPTSARCAGSSAFPSRSAAARQLSTSTPGTCTADEADWLRDRRRSDPRAARHRAARGGAVGGRPVGRRPRRRRPSSTALLVRDGRTGRAQRPRSWRRCAPSAAASSSRRCARSPAGPARDAGRRHVRRRLDHRRAAVDRRARGRRRVAELQRQRATRWPRRSSPPPAPTPRPPSSWRWRSPPAAARACLRGRPLP